MRNSTDLSESNNINGQQVEQERMPQPEIELTDIRDCQLREISEKLTDYENILKEMKKKRWEEDQWEYYLQSGGKTNPLIPQEVNDYISIWRDLTENESTKDIMRECHSCLQLINKLETDLEDAPEKNSNWIISHKNLQDLLHKKLDKATYIFLQVSFFNSI
ncbi:protein CASC1-like isoform X1 [Centruroides sculpturatus]|uniref:protein CASC1-like isoform X1 n=1 Tax=Centruroides sculpturatus TaxID=218467 RepID=UPI000C6EDAE6|nr:protein CASC1-like isoform X1 [Centruroides sculpturatus]